MSVADTTNIPDAVPEAQNSARSIKSASDSQIREQTAVRNDRIFNPRSDPEEKALKYGATHIIQIFVPVSICMLFVVLTMAVLGNYDMNPTVNTIYTPFIADENTPDSEKFFMSLGNALIFMGVIICSTIFVVVIYKYKFYMLMTVWMFLTTLILFFCFSAVYLEEFLNRFNLPTDCITIGFIVWNYGVLGNLVVHWKGPLVLQQVALVSISVLMALLMLRIFPEWTLWLVLGFLAIWDLIAVLTPFGPLKVLVELAQERNEPLFPAMIYTAGVLYTFVIMQLTEPEEKLPSTTEETEMSVGTSVRFVTSESPSSSGHVKRYAPLRTKEKKSNGCGQSNTVGSDLLSSNEDRFRLVSQQSSSTHPHSIVGDVPRAQQQQQMLSEDNSEMESGVKLGLGDFIFYSILVGKASSYGDLNITLACYVAILVGLCLTLFLLAVYRKALPALPISITFGIIYFFVTRAIITPFTSEISYRQYSF